MTRPPVPVVSWDQPDEEWHAARRQGCGASDVSALLGFDRHRSPWQVWAEKTGHPLAPDRSPTEASELGLALEGWLINQAGRLAFPDMEEYTETCILPGRLYAHPEHSWRRCSPDGALAVFAGPATNMDLPLPDRLIQAKTAGLVSGRAPGWGDISVPLGIEFQARWETHVMDAEVNHIVALVAGRGLCHYPIIRDMAIEDDLVEQVSAWWECHVVGGDEPPLTGRDAAVVAALYPRVQRNSIDLDDTDAMDHWRAYHDAHLDLKDAEERKALAATQLKALLGAAHFGRVAGQLVAAWGERRGRVDYERLARELYIQLCDLLAGVAEPLVPPRFEELAEEFRGPIGRTFTIKE